MTQTRPVPIVGTVGVPARYGGFETLAEQLCVQIPPDDVALIVYCEKNAYSAAERDDNAFRGHRRVFVPLRANGLSSLFYDALALLHATFVIRADDVFVFGYSGAWILPILKLLRPGTRYVVNVDGMEWRRDKFSRPTRLLLKALELCAARGASTVIADNDALAALFRNRYGREPVTIAYGGDHTIVDAPSAAPQPSGHYLAIARIEPENNADLILEACRRAAVRLVFIGNWNANDYGRALRRQYGDVSGIWLLDPIYDQADLDPWRHGAIGYIHGHSVGGTNPSLVEALFHTQRLLSFDCAFNRATLSDAGGYFRDIVTLIDLLRATPQPVPRTVMNELRDRYRWRSIAARYRALVSR